MRSTLTRTGADLLDEQWSMNGQYVRATICPSGYGEGVGACVFSGSTGAFAWIATEGYGSPKPYYICWGLDLELGRGSFEPTPLSFCRQPLSLADVRNAFGAYEGSLVDAEKRTVFVRKGEYMVLFATPANQSINGRPFSIKVTPEIRETARKFLELYPQKK